MNINFLIPFIVLLWFIAIVRMILLQASVWQLKEYRWDRMREYLRLPSTARGMLSPLELAKWLLLVCFLAGQNIIGFFPLFVFAVFVLDLVILIKEVRGHIFARPKMTLKAVLIVLLSYCLVLLVAFITLFNSGVNVGAFLLAERAVSLCILAVILVIHPISRVLIRKKIQFAKQKRASFHNVVSVGITGSYGKSSTKNFLTTFLAGESFIATEGNTNTEIGVAQFIFSKLTVSTKYLIAEMGAYRLGEIKSLTEIVQPKIGILTAVGNQHLGLFGSLENIRRAKYELISALPSDGTAIFNNDDLICADLATKTKHCRVLTYGSSEGVNLRAQVLGSDENGTEVKISGLVPETIVQLPVLGRHQLSNVLGAITGALTLGIVWEEIVKKVPLLKAEKQTMEKRVLHNGAMIIDDSYNSNVVGVISAINSLKEISRKNKIIVLVPMIELGADAENAHKIVGEALGGTATIVYYSGNDYEKSLLEGVKKINPNLSIVTKLSPQAIMSELRKTLNNDTVILLEGRVPKIIREELQ